MGLRPGLKVKQLLTGLNCSVKIVDDKNLRRVTLALFVDVHVQKLSPHELSLLEGDSDRGFAYIAP